MLGLFQFRQAHSSLPQPRSMVIWAKRRRRALPIALAAVLRHDEQVFQIDPRPAQKGGEVVEKQGVAHRFSLHLGKDDLRRLFLKNPLPQNFRGGYHLVGHVLVIRQGADKAQNQFLVPGPWTAMSYSVKSFH